MCIRAPGHGKIHSSQIHPWIFCRDYRCRDWGRISHWTPCCKSQGDVSDLLPIQITIGSPLRDPGGNCNRRAGVCTHLWPVASRCSSGHIAARWIRPLIGESWGCLLYRMLFSKSHPWAALSMHELMPSFLHFPFIVSYVDVLLSLTGAFVQANLFFPNLKHNTEALCRAKR